MFMYGCTFARFYKNIMKKNNKFISREKDQASYNKYYKYKQ